MNCCNLFSNLYVLVKDWQTSLVTIPTLLFALHSWEIDFLVPAMDRKNIVTNAKCFQRDSR